MVGVLVVGVGVPATGSPSTTVFRLTYPPHLRTVTTVLRCPHSCPAGHSWVSVSREVPTRTGWRYRGGPRRGQQGTGVVGVPGVHVPVIYIGHPHTGIPLGMWSDTVSPPLRPTLLVGPSGTPSGRSILYTREYPEGTEGDPECMGVHGG